MFRLNVTTLSVLAVSLLMATTVQAEGNITFGGTPAVRDTLPTAAVSAKATPATLGQTDQQPGVNRAILSPATPAESEQAIRARALPANLNRGVKSLPIPVKGATTAAKTTAQVSALRISGDTAAGAPASIPELARALKNDPDRIYEYVRNTIEYTPTWGIQKGAVGALLDNQGTAFDQAALMVALLRQSGFTASVVLGRINLTAAQVHDWLGIDTSKVCAVLNLLGNGQIPIASVTASAAGSCPGSTAALVSLKVSHAWVKATIDGTSYVFDPSFKPHAIQTAVDLNAATGYNAASYLTAATSGATVTADYVQNVNRTNVRNNLTTYANTLATYLRTNTPAGGLDDVIGGKTIAPYVGANLRQATLPYQDTTVALTEWAAEIPNTYKAALRIQYSGIDQTYTSDAIYGKRLTLTYNASNQPVLTLDGTPVVTGTVVTAGSVGTVSFTVTHPYAQTFANQSFSQSIKAGGTFVIGNGWGPAGRGLIENYRSRLEDARAAGAADASEAVLGSSLAVLSATWIAQVNHSDYITDRLAKTNTLFHHQIGIAGYNTAPYVDLPGNMLSVISEAADTAKESAVFFSASMHSSIFESTAVQQINGVSAVSTVKLIDMAVASGDKIFDAKAANYATVVQPALVSCTAWATAFQTAINAGRRLILPTRCNLVENSWTGTGYFSILVGTSSSNIGSIIGGGLAGGFSSSTWSPALTVSNGLTNSASSSDWIQTLGQTFGDPIDMVKGNYLYARNDITVGAGDFPHSLSIQKLYSSGARNQPGTLGKGWTHNLAASVAVGSDGFQGMGEDSALDAVTTIVEQLVSLDLLSDTTKPLNKMVVATLGQRWFGDQLLGNTVIVRQGLNGEVFVKLPDGTYNAPPGNATKLIKNADGTYSYETLHKARLNFNSAGKLATYVHPSGAQANFSYSGNDLAQVQNSLGRTLTFTNVSGRITQVSDGTRSVKYAYDASGNLATFTDATNQNTTFQYDLPGRMTQVLYPSNPTIAFATNVYDTLSRVQTQTNANGKLYSYYFAGTRSEEVAPGGISKVSYLDALGKVVRSIDPVGRIILNTYDGQSRLVKSVLPEGNSVEYDYDDAPCLAQNRCTHNVKAVRQVAKAGSGLATLASSFTYESSFNKVASATDPRGQVTTYTYTAQGNPLTVTAPADSSGVQPVTTFAYTAYAPASFPSVYLQTGVTAKTGASTTVTTSTTYNAANKYVPQSSIVDAGGLNLTSTYTYDAIGNLTQVDGPRGDVADIVSYAYDAERRLTQTTDALGKVTQQAYDADGHPVRSAAQIGSQWLVSCQSYSPSGKVVKRWGPAQTAAATTCPTAAAPVAVTDTAYDDLDRLIRVTANLPTAEGGSRVTETAYNADDSVLRVSRAVGTALAQAYATYSYTPNGLPASLADAKGNLTTWQYDGLDRKLKTLYPDKVSAGVSSATDYEQYAYDANGNPISLRKRNGQSVALVYDNLNRLTARTYPTTADNVAYAYDLLGRRTAASFANASYSIGYAWDNAGRLASATAGGKAVAYQYDAAGNRVRTTWPEATPFYVSATFDALNRPTAIKELGTTTLASYAYDDLSRRTTVTLGNGSTTDTTYTAQGALASLAHNLTGTAQDVSTTYTRNQVQEIVGRTWTNDLYAWSGVANGTKAYTSNGQNQYTAVAGATLAYDGNGNLTGDGVWTYGYDLDNRLTSAAQTGYAATLAYDGEGRLRQTTLAGTVSNLLYDGTDLIAEYDAANALLRRYVHGPGVDEPLVWYEGAGTTSKTWLYADHQGSIVAQADATGTSTATYSYGPFGEPNQTTGSRFRYTGQQFLGPLNLYYYKARFYSPAIGRFLQTDPIGVADDLNLYAYVGNNSINRNDPTGLAWEQAQMLGGKFWSTTKSLAADSYYAARNDGFGGSLMKGIDGSPVGVEYGMAAGAVLGSIKSVSTTARASSKVLGAALEDAGFVREIGDAAHHIVAGGAQAANEAREILKQFGVGINDAANGVFLPASKAIAGASDAVAHAVVHTNEYYNSVTTALRQAISKQDVVDVLSNIRASLLNGGKP